MPRTASKDNTSCVPTTSGSRTLSLPVLPESSAGKHRGLNAWSKAHPLIKHSRIGKWRAGVLIFVYVLMAAHLVQWLITGLTVSPVEPSESMYTLRDGAVNAGFVFFVLAILSTLIFGRYFCGWGCHIVAVQDLCAWIMMKVGVKPRPFRSRLLMLVPVGLAFYMFAWPVVVRDVVRPLLADSRGHLPDWMGQIDPLPGYRSAFLVQDYWATFATWYVAIPFILVCGAVTVYFLGAKAFCTYGCPYGGIFGPVDLAAPGRIVVNDNCEHCGHCTAVCTSNVRVHEEVRDFGMVVDPGCMKCMDCVSVCPNDALSFGFAKPALFAKPRAGAEESAAKAKALRAARWDLTWPEEIACLLIFVLLFLCYRGMFNQVPMLMAVAMAGLGAWACWKTWRLLRDANSRVHGMQLKFKGRIGAWGIAFALATLACLVVAGWSGYVRWNLLRAQIAYQRLDTPIDIVLRPDFAPTPDDVSRATAALEFYRKAAPPGAMGTGGAGFLWPLRPEEWLNVGYLRLLAGDWDGAEAATRRVIDEGHPKDDLVFQLVRTKEARNRRALERMGYQGYPQAEIAKAAADFEARRFALLEEFLAKHDDLMRVRAQVLLKRIRDAAGPAPETPDPARDARIKAAIEGAEAEMSAAVDRQRYDAAGILSAAAFFADVKDGARAKNMIDRALKIHDPKPEVLVLAANLLVHLGENDRAIELAGRVAEAGKRLPGPRMGAAGILAQAGKPELAIEQVMLAVERARSMSRSATAAEALVNAGTFLLNMDVSIEASLRPLTREQLAARAGQIGFDAASKPAEELLQLILEAERRRLKLDGIPLIREGAAMLKGNEWSLMPTAGFLQQNGATYRRESFLKEALALLEDARAVNPDAPTIRRDLAETYWLCGQPDDGLKEFRSAAELAKKNALLADRASQAFEARGKMDEATFWGSEAHRRGEAPTDPF